MIHGKVAQKAGLLVLGQGTGSGIYADFPVLSLLYPDNTKLFFQKMRLVLPWRTISGSLQKKYYYNALGRSLFVSVVTTLTTLVVGVPIAYVMSRYNVVGKRFIHILSS